MNALAIAALAVLSWGGSDAPPERHIPATNAVALDGRNIVFPRDLARGGTVLILGFSRGSEDATTRWGRQVKAELVRPPAVTFYEMPVLEEVPSLLRGMVTRSIRKKIAEPLRANFVPLTQDEALWKQLAGFSASSRDAAYVLLVDHDGIVRWKTHDAFSPESFAFLKAETQKLSGPPQ